jgi:hypothetical protein
MKKLLTLAIVFTLAFAVVSCKKTDPAADNQTATATTDTAVDGKPSEGEKTK